MEQRVNVNFCVKLHKPPSEKLEILRTVYGKSPRQRCHGYQNSKIKIMLICFLDISGIIHFEFVLKEIAVNRIF
jgi:hypothetical protein